MNITTRRIMLWITAAIGAFVGLWAAWFPLGFYQAFPGLGRVWIAIDGPYNEHLIRDVGALYLGLACASAVAARSAHPDASRAVGAAWIAFSVPHLLYHLLHLHGLSPLDVVLQVFSLSSTIILGVPLVLPARGERSGGVALAAGRGASEAGQR